MAFLIRFFLLLNIIWCFGLVVNAQNTPCYNKYQSEGMALANDKQYGDAILKYVAGLATCTDLPANHDLSRRIQETKEAWVRDLKATSEREKRAYQDAITAKERAENLQTAEAAARKEAQTNADLAYQRGIKTESLRLALLADMARQRGHKTEALLLSWMAIEYAAKERQALVMRAFGDAVCDTFTQAVFTQSEPILSARFWGQDGKKMIVQTADRRFFILNLTTSPAQTIQLDAGFTAAEPSPWGDRLAVWGAANTVSLLGPDGNQLAVLRGHTEQVRHVCFSQDGQSVLTCSRDNTARLWRGNGDLISTLTGHTGNVQEGFFLPNDLQIATRGSEGALRVWSTDGTPQRLQDKDSEFVRQVWVTNDNIIITTFASGRIALETSDGRFTYSIGNQFGAYNLAAFPAVGDAYCLTGKGQKQFAIYSKSDQKAYFFSHPSTVQGVVAHPASSTFLTWADDRILRIWDEKGQLLHTLTGHRGDIVSAVFHAERKLVLSTSKDGTAKLWDYEGNIEADWSLGTTKPVAAVFSPDGTQILVLNNSGKSLSLAPFPEDILKKTNRDVLLKAEITQQLLKKNDVQFLETLGLK